MKEFRERTEIAQALNFGKYPVVTFDISKCDEYGLVGSLVRVDMGTFSDGSAFLERVTARVFEDEGKLTFSAHAFGISSSYGWHDFSEDLTYATAPVLKKDSDFVVVVLDSEVCEVYKVLLVHSGAIHKFCTKPIETETVDLSNYIAMASARYHRF